MKYFTLFTAVFLAQACATTRLDKVPEVDCTQLDALQMQKITKRNLTVKIYEEKKIYVDAGNAELVANKIKSLLECSAEKGGFKVTQDSLRQLTIHVVDCAQDPTQPDVSQTACLILKTELKTPTFKYSGEVDVSHSYVRGNSTFHMVGDMDEAYRNSLQMIIRNLNEKIKD